MKTFYHSTHLKSLSELCRIPFNLRVFLFIVTGLMFGLAGSYAATYYSRQTGNWSTRSTWSTSSGGNQVNSGVYPVAGDVVIIERGFTVTVNGNYACASVLLGGPGTNSGAFLTFSGTNRSLTVSGTVTIGGSGNTGRTGRITFTSGSSLDAGNMVLGGTAATPAAGTIIMTAGGSLTTDGLTVNTVSGNTWTPGTGTVILVTNNTLPATIFTNFNNLQVNAGTTTTGAALPTISGSLTVKAGAVFSLAHNVGATAGPTSVDLECGGATGSTVSGAGTLTLGGNVTVTTCS